MGSGGELDGAKTFQGSGTIGMDFLSVPATTYESNLHLTSME
jgi:hypothetical protein